MPNLYCGGMQMICVGVDVSKGKSTVAAIDENGEIFMKASEYEHTEIGMTELIQKLRTLKEEPRIVVENTGYYHWPLVNSLMDAGFFVCVVNSIIVSKFAKVQMRPGKTDRLDAIMLCRFGLAHWTKLVQCQPDEERRTLLRLYSREYSYAVHLVVEQKVHFTSLLDKVMPGIKTLLEDKGGRSKLSDFALEFWHFENISKQKPDSFTKRYCKWAKEKGYHANESKAAQIHALSQNGIPTLPCTDAVKQLVQEAARVLKRLEESVNSILAQMNALASTFPEFEVVSEMKGVGKHTASRLIAEIGDVRRFHSAKALTAYAGLDAPPYQSGEFESHNRKISKRGNKYLRKVGYEVMASLMSTKPVEDHAVYLFICRKKAEGKYYLSAYMAGLNKFLHIYYARVCEVMKEPT